MLCTASSAAAGLKLADLPSEVIEHVVLGLEALSDLAAVNATSRLFRGAPGGRSPVERALRQRARARGHERALPAKLPSSAGSVVAELFERERVLALASAHTLVAMAESVDYLLLSAFVDAEGGLHTCGEELLVRTADDDPIVCASHAALGHGDRHQPPVLVPTRVASLSAVRVCAVAGSCSHLLALSDAGAVYACGWNFSGELGLGDTQARWSLELVRALSREVVVCIASGSMHSLALTVGGTAYSWGHNAYGELGHGDTEDWLEPTRIEALAGVHVGGVSADSFYTLLVSTSGAVYVCGNNPCEGIIKEERLPTHVRGLAGVRVVHVSAGATHCLLVDDTGAVYSWGTNKHGELGHADCLPADPVPMRVDALAGVRAVRACARGKCVSAVLGSDGSVYAFGRKSRDLLWLDGTDDDGHPELPTRIPEWCLPEHVVDCSISEGHALFVTADGAVHSCGFQGASLGQGVSAADDSDEDFIEPARIGWLPPVLARSAARR